MRNWIAVSLMHKIMKLCFNATMLSFRILVGFFPSWGMFSVFFIEHFIYRKKERSSFEVILAEESIWIEECSDFQECQP